MYIQCAHKNVVRDLAVEAYAVDKVRSRVEKLVDNPVGIHLTFERRQGKGTTANCRIIAGGCPSVNASFSATSFLQAIDGLVDALAEQLRRKKTRKAPRRRPAPLLEKMEEHDWDDWFYEEHAIH